MEGSRPAISTARLVLAILLLAGLVVFSLLHVHEARRFARLAEQAEPVWLLVAAAVQAGTYACAGAIWGQVAASAGHRLPPVHLARLAVEKLGIDQFVPTGGMSGNLVVMSAMRRMGLPPAVAAEALLVDLLSYYAAFAAAALVSLAVLRFHHDVTPVIVALLGLFALLAAGVPLGIAWLLKHRSYRPGPRLARIRILQGLLETLQQVSVRRVWNPRLLATTTALQVGIVLLDAATLWAMLRALGIHAHPLTAFVALAIATIAGVFSFLPGGVGSFEAGATATLALLGVPVEAALTGTLLLRGLSLWLPLIPGLILAHGDLGAGRAEAGPADVARRRGRRAEGR